MDVRFGILSKFVLLAGLVALSCVGVASAAETEGAIIGIDLGTTYSCVGVYQSGRVEIIANDQGNRITPSYVAFTPEGDRLVGDAAKNQLTTNPSNTVFDVKRLMGRAWDEPSVKKDVKYMPFGVVNKNDKPHIEVSRILVNS